MFYDVCWLEEGVENGICVNTEPNYNKPLELLSKQILLYKFVL